MSSVDGVSEEYAQPYFEVVDPDPGLDEMRQVVCDKGIRSTIPERWQAEEASQDFDKLSSLTAGILLVQCYRCHC
jgi:hypothetical protein